MLAALSRSPGNLTLLHYLSLQPDFLHYLPLQPDLHYLSLQPDFTQPWQPDSPAQPVLATRPLCMICPGLVQ